MQKINIYPTVAKRVVESTIDLSAPAGKHTLRIEPLDPVIVFEKIVIDCGGWQATASAVSAH